MMELRYRMQMIGAVVVPAIIALWALAWLLGVL